MEKSLPSYTPNWTAVFAGSGNALPLVPVSGSGGVATTVGSTAYPATINKISPIVTASNVGTKSDQVSGGSARRSIRRSIMPPPSVKR